MTFVLEPDHAVFCLGYTADARRRSNTAPSASSSPAGSTASRRLIFKTPSQPPRPIGSNKLRFRKSCKPNFVCALAGGENHFSKRPYPKRGELSFARSGPLHRFLFGLAPDGVFRAPSIALGAVGSYSTFSPLPRFRRTAAVCFLWHFPSQGLSTAAPASIPPLARKVTRRRALRSSDFPPSTRGRRRFSALPKSGANLLKKPAKTRGNHRLAA